MITSFDLTGINLKSSCADLIRASTSLFRTLEGVDGRDRPGQDEISGSICSVIRPQDFPRTALRTPGTSPGRRVRGIAVVLALALLVFPTWLAAHEAGGDKRRPVIAAGAVLRVDLARRQAGSAGRFARQGRGGHLHLYRLPGQHLYARRQQYPYPFPDTRQRQLRAYPETGDRFGSNASPAGGLIAAIAVAPLRRGA